MAINGNGKTPPLGSRAVRLRIPTGEFASSLQSTRLHIPEPVKLTPEAKLVFDRMKQAAQPDLTPRPIDPLELTRYINVEPVQKKLEQMNEQHQERLLGEKAGSTNLLKWQVDTAIGSLHEKNEDAAAVSRIKIFLKDKNGRAIQKEALLAVVCDGVSRSHRGGSGALASIKAVEDFMFSILAKFSYQDLSNWSPESILDEIKKSVESTNEQIKNIEGAGNTTIAASLIIENKLYVVYAGDSRLYVLRGEQIAAMTLDHSLKQQLAQFGITGTVLHGLSAMLGRIPEENHFVGSSVAKGVIEINLPFSLFEQTPIEEVSPNNPIYRDAQNDFILLGQNIGGGDARKSSLEGLKTACFELQPNDFIFIVSDGVPFGDLLPAARMVASGTLQAAAAEAIKKARENAANTDNATVIAISFDYGNRKKS